MDNYEKMFNISRLQAIIDQFDWYDPQYNNTEELAGFLSSKGVVAPPCKVGAKVWAYAPIGGLCECTVVEIMYYLNRADCWSIYCSTSCGFAFCVNRVYESREEALKPCNSVK